MIKIREEIEDIAQGRVPMEKRWVGLVVPVSNCTFGLRTISSYHSRSWVEAWRTRSYALEVSSRPSCTFEVRFKQEYSRWNGSIVGAWLINFVALYVHAMNYP